MSNIRHLQANPGLPINPTYSGPAVPVAYDQKWQLYNNFTPDQIAWFQAQPEWQNFVAWVALDPPNATIHADAPDMATIIAALTAANQPIAVNPTPIVAVPPTPKSPV